MKIALAFVYANDPTSRFIIDPETSSLNVNSGKSIKKNHKVNIPTFYSKSCYKYLPAMEVFEQLSPSQAVYRG